MNCTKALFFNTLQKEFRSKTLIFLLVLTLGPILLLYYAMDFISNMELTRAFFESGQEKVFTIFYFIVNAWTFLLAAILGTNCVKGDQEGGVFMQLFALPISRRQYLAVRILGTWAIVISYYLFSLFLSFLVLSQFSNLPDMDMKTFTGLLGGMGVNSLAILASVTIAVWHSLFLPKIFSFIKTLTMFFFISIANHYWTTHSFEEALSPQVSVVKLIGALIHSLFPRLGTLNDISNSLMLHKAEALANPDTSPLFEMAHFALSFSILFMATAFFFRRKELD